MLFAATCHHNSETLLSLPHIPFAPKSGCDFCLHLGIRRRSHRRRRAEWAADGADSRRPSSPRAQVEGGKRNTGERHRDFLKRGQLRVLFRANVVSASLLNKQGWGGNIISRVSTTKSGLCVHERETERGLPP